MNEKLFDWENFPHTHGSHGGHHSLDFDSLPPRAYKQHDFVRLYNGGPLEIAGNPYRDPHQLQELARAFDLDFRLWSDLSGIQLFAPDWRPVRKGGTDLDCVLLDHNHNLVIAPSWGKGKVIYYSPWSWPSGGHAFTAFLPNRDRAKRLKLVLRDTLALALTYYTMRDCQVPEDGTNQARTYIEDALASRRSFEATPEHDGSALAQLGMYVANKEIDTRIARWTEDEIKTQWLRFKVK